tara:strand:+ start:2615 stop:2935 length:321 start_codon:yes stop_codon:yes gene_type:complete
MKTLCKTTYPEQEIIDARACAAGKGLSGVRLRVFSLLYQVKKESTGYIASECQCGNVSAAVNAMQDHLKEHGLFIRNYYPETGLKNKFGEPTRAHIWELVGYEVAE